MNSGSCEADWAVFDDHCYLYMNNSGARYDDIEVCRCVKLCDFQVLNDLLHIRSECSSLGGSLASIHNREENDFVFNLIIPHADDGYYGRMWLGANSADGTYEWDDGTAWDYENWNQGYLYFKTFFLNLFTHKLIR